MTMLKAIKTLGETAFLTRYEKDGRVALEAIRKIEEDNGIYGLDGVNIFMTMVLDDPKNILGAFRSRCEAYLIKPIDKQTLFDELRSRRLLKELVQ